ncbi:hypothetical protein [Nocardia sp. NPDC005366]|uniref:hypothetical protein n=1 Tax=Nocardia sp. NPDC005366 TaxID=3156878 RepID=UPI0033A3E09B
MLQAVTSPASGNAPGRCQFPGCTATVAARPPGRPGAPRSYCADPDHTAQKALRLKRRDTDRGARSTPVPPSPRPITDGTATLAGLLDRYGQLRAELGAVVSDAAEVLADLGDPALVEREIAEIQRDAASRIAAAEQRRDNAEKASAELQRRYRHAVELEQLALAAADEAHTRAEDADTRLGEVEQRSAALVAAAEADRDEIYAEAETVLTEMRGHLDIARAAQARAEGERDQVREQHESLVAENHELRAQMDAQRAEHRTRLELRDVEYSRAITAAHAMADRAAREHRDQVGELIKEFVVAGGGAGEPRAAISSDRPDRSALGDPEG